MYTMDDLAAAKEALRQWTVRWENYDGNNPDKYQSDLKAARQKVRAVEQSLKDQGVLRPTDQEMLERELDEKFPAAQSKDIVEHDGNRYQLRFFPLEKSRSGKTVTDWGRSWEKVTAE